MVSKQAILTEDEEVIAKEELVVTEEDPSKKVEAHDDDDEDIDPENPDKGESVVDETEAIRERRRKEKIERKERRDKAIARDKTELEFLRKQNDALERSVSEIKQRQHQADVGTVEQRMREAANEVDMAEKVIAKAVAAGNGDDVAQAMRYRDQAIAKVNQLHNLKQQAVRNAPQPKQNQLDDRTLRYAQEFVKENSWYDPQGRNEDSSIVLAIDQTLVRDGYQPNTEEYWSELRKRAARRLPEHFKDTGDVSERQVRGGPALGSGKEHAPTSTRREVYISPERKQALIDAGVWDDPVLRMKYVKRYSEYDKNNRA